MIVQTFLRTTSFGAAALACVLALGMPAMAQSQQIAIDINGSAIDVNPAPVIQAGRVFVPLRGVFENLGASVVYDAGEINATGGGRTISLHLGSTQATVDGDPQTIDVAPFLIGDSTYVPLRFISEALGASVSWDEESQTVSISTGNQQPVAEQPQPLPAAQPYVDDSYVTQPPPPLPAYEQPPVPDPDAIWQPGYWAFGEAGYYWVPGTWVEAPQPNYLWTPPYWGFHSGYFGFHPGYWALAVGFYGGIDYGGGYFGNGYAGGRWRDDHFAYNTAVTRVVDRTIIKNVYIDRTVINVTNVDNYTTVNRISYNGGPRGIDARPTAAQLEAERRPHLAPTVVQVQHVEQAAHDRRFLATVNGGKPAIVVAPRPFSADVKPAGALPIEPEDKVRANKLVAPPARIDAAPVVPQTERRYTEPRAVQLQNTEPKAETRPYVIPKTAEPHYVEPKLETRPYVAPKTPAPAYVAPKTTAPVYVAPKTEERRYVAPNTVAPRVIAPRVIPPRVVAPQYVAPRRVLPTPPVVHPLVRKPTPTPKRTDDARAR